MSITGVGQLPVAIQSVLERWASSRLRIIPIRHHSPACAFSLLQLLHEWRPDKVLIEAPYQLQSMIPLLQRPETKPPVALCWQRNATTGSIILPLVEYSPEWVALRWAGEAGSTVTFMDDPICPAEGSVSRVTSEDDREILQQSAYFLALTRSLGCRNASEVWEHLFELKSREQLVDWRTHFGQVALYCSIIREQLSDEQLDSSGTRHRDECMADYIQQAMRTDGESRVLAVVGGLHLAGILQCLERTAPHSIPGSTPTGNAISLIAYHDYYLDEMSGYRAGVSAPRWQREVWERLGSAECDALRSACQALVLQYAEFCRGISRSQLNTSVVTETLLHASRLAVLRGHAGPGFHDVSDAMRANTTRVVDDADADATQLQFRDWLRGDRLGVVPADVPPPLLVLDVRNQLRQLRFKTSLFDVVQVDLDLFRKPRHREKSRFLHRLSVLGVPFATRLRGPATVVGRRLDLVHEIWQTVWSPMAEVRLRECAPLGSSLATAVDRQLVQTLGDIHKNNPSLTATVDLLRRACLTHSPSAMELAAINLSTLAESEPSTAIVAECLDMLLGVQRTPGLDSETSRRWLGSAMTQLWRCAWRRLGSVHRGNQAVDEDAVAALGILYACANTGEFDKDWAAQLDEYAVSALTAQERPPGVCGACAGALYVSNRQLPDHVDAASLVKQSLDRYLTPWMDADKGAAFITGLLRLAAPAVARWGEAVDLTVGFIQHWDEETFIRWLPELRDSFSCLKPAEASDLAIRIGEISGDVVRSDVVTDWSNAQLKLHLRVNAQVIAALQDYGWTSMKERTDERSD